MKFAVFNHKGKKHLGRLVDSETFLECLDLPESAFEQDGVVSLINRPLPNVTEKISISDVELLAPVPRPRRNIFCVGKNYYAHAEEFAASGFDSSAAKGAVPEAPIVFSKLPETVEPTGAPIKLDTTVTNTVDYEAELALIIGTPGKNISRENALSHIWGYTIVNDVTSRDLQGHHSQWLIGKSQDSFCPMGPWAVTADEIDLADTSVKCWVNGELRQDSNTGLLIFDVPTVIAAISNGITLKAGDVIATGTPAGVGIGFNPPKYLAAGDIVKIKIDGIGTLENPVEEI